MRWLVRHDALLPCVLFFKRPFFGSNICRRCWSCYRVNVGSARIEPHHPSCVSTVSLVSPHRPQSRRMASLWCRKNPVVTYCAASFPDHLQLHRLLTLLLVQRRLTLPSLWWRRLHANKITPTQPPPRWFRNEDAHVHIAMGRWNACVCVCCCLVCIRELFQSSCHQTIP